MGRRVVLKTTNHDTGNGQESEVILEDEEIHILEAFISEYERLADSLWIRSGMEVKINMTWHDDKGMEFEADLPPWDDVIVVLHKLRPFTLNNEATNFHRIRNLLAKTCADSEFRTMLDRLKERYTGKHMHGYMKFGAGNRVLNSEDTLTDWLNAFEYHRDEQKREALEEINRVFPEDFSKGVFLNLIVERLKCIGAMAGLVHSLLTPDKPFTVRFQ